MSFKSLRFFLAWKWAILASLAYFILLLFVISQHEPWRDEADIWLAARDIPSFYDLNMFCRSTGHPPLWHILVIPLAKSGLPYISMHILHAIIATMAVFVFWKNSPFHPVLKLLFSFSYFMFFEYGVIARNYSLGILFLFLIASLYPKRKIYPIVFGTLVFFLCNTSFYFSIIASGIFLINFIENIKEKNYEPSDWIGLALQIAGGLICLTFVYPPSDGQFHSSWFIEVNRNHPFKLMIAISQSALPGNGSFVAGLLLFVFTFFGTWRYSGIGFLFLWSYFWIGMFYILVYMQGYRHAGVLIYLILFVLWISEKEKFNHFRGVSISISVLSRKIGILLFAICTFYSMRFGYKEARKDLLYSFSGGKEAAEFIQKNHFDNEDYILSAHKADNAKSILPYLNTKNLYDPATDHYGSYSLWNKKYTEANFFSQEIAVQTIRNKFPNQKVLFISTTKSPSPQNLGMELIYETNSRVEFYKDEIFYLYKLY